MLVALSGTPGTGKTSVSKILKQKGYKIIDLNQFANELGFITGFDNKRDTKIIDMSGLNKYFKDTFSSSDLIFLDGHSSHLINSTDYVIILRCHPKTLFLRLETKGWKKEKIKENIDAEILDIILCEAYEIHKEDKIFEINTTDGTIEDIVFSIEEIIKKDFKPIDKFKIGKIDWSEEILKDF
jgi:adenylate kinase